MIPIAMYFFTIHVPVYTSSYIVIYPLPGLSPLG